MEQEGWFVWFVEQYFSDNSLHKSHPENSSMVTLDATLRFWQEGHRQDPEVLVS